MLIQCYVMFNKLLLNLYSFKIATQSIKCKWNLSKSVKTGTIFHSKLWTSTESCFYLIRSQNKKNKCCKNICTVLNLKLLMCRFLEELSQRKYLTNRCLFATQKRFNIIVIMTVSCTKLSVFFSSSVIKPSD